MGGFEEGGFTGHGGQGQPAGVVHRGEYVFSAPAVQRIGVPLLDAMHNGAGLSPIARIRAAASSSACCSKARE